MSAQRFAEMDAILFHRIRWLVTPAQQRNNRMCHSGDRSQNFMSVAYLRIAGVK